jgi:hypothetical protein
MDFIGWGGKAVRAFARTPIRAMRPHEWGNQSSVGFMCVPPASSYLAMVCFHIMTFTSTNFKHVSDGVSVPLTRAYKAGGFGLAILTLGAILMLTAFFLSGPTPIRYTVLAIGALLTFFTLIYVYIKELLPLRHAQAGASESMDMIDAIQKAAIELTDLASDFQALAFKNASQIATVLTQARPILRSLPLIGGIADSEMVVQADKLSGVIVSTTQNAREVILNLKKALINADPSYIESHLADLKSYRTEVENMLAGKG